MKTPAFAYARATSVGNAIALLAEHGERAKRKLHTESPPKSLLELACMAYFMFGTSACKALSFYFAAPVHFRHAPQ